MKRLVIVLALAALVLAGCASNTIQTPFVGPNGQLVLDKDGKPLMTTQSFTDSAMFAQAQQVAAAQAKPIMEMTFPNGGAMPAGAILRVWGGNGAPRVVQYREPWLDAMRYSIPFVTTLGLGYLWQQSLANVAGATTYNVTGGAQSPIAIQSRQNAATAIGGTGAATDGGGAGGAGGPATATVTSTPTTTTNDSSQHTLGVGF